MSPESVGGNLCHRKRKQLIMIILNQGIQLKLIQELYKLFEDNA